MTTEQLKLAVKAQTLLEVFENSGDRTSLLQQAKECIDKLIEADKQSGYTITTSPGWRGIDVSPTGTDKQIDWSATSITNIADRSFCPGPTTNKLKG